MLPNYNHAPLHLVRCHSGFLSLQDSICIRGSSWATIGWPPLGFSALPSSTALGKCFFLGSLDEHGWLAFQPHVIYLLWKGHFPEPLPPFLCCLEGTPGISAFSVWAVLAAWQPCLGALPGYHTVPTMEDTPAWMDAPYCTLRFCASRSSPCVPPGPVNGSRLGPASSSLL